jgi:hypothetical protein
MHRERGAMDGSSEDTRGLRRGPPFEDHNYALFTSSKSFVKQFFSVAAASLASDANELEGGPLKMS